MSTPHRGGRLLPMLLAALLTVPILASAQTEGGGGVLVQFPLKPFEDTLYMSIDAAYRLEFSDDGDVWYTTQSGVVHIDPVAHRREVFTKMEGLPSSYALGIAIRGDTVYAGTELGLAIINRTTGAVTAKTTLNSPLNDEIVQEVTLDGDTLWLGTYFRGVAMWNLTTDQWTFHNTSTTADYAKPVRRIVPTEDAVWVATLGNGLWKYDRATKEWSVTLKEDGLVSQEVRTVAEAGRNLWVGTDKGLQVWRPYAPYDGTPDEWVLFNKSNSRLPDDVITDLDLIPTEAGTIDIFAGTRDGLWQYDGSNDTVRDQSFGILGSFILDNVFAPRHGWAIATQRGVSLQRSGNWTYYTTGPSSTEVPSQGPHTFLFTSASVGDQSDLLFFGGPNGVTGYRPAEGDRRAVWYNRAEWSEYPGGPVNWIDTDGGITWVGSNTGTYGFRHATQSWIERKVLNSRNLVYGVEADRGELWIALFGDGLIMRNLTTGLTRSWDFTTTPPLPDQHLTDIRAQGNDMWIGSGIGVLRLDRVSGTVTAAYTTGEGIPGDGVVFRLLPEGNVVWIGTKNGGLARLDVPSGRVTKTWSSDANPGFPEGEIRSLHREGSRLWVGTTDGLVRVDVRTGAFKTYRTTDSDLVQAYVNGITSKDGILYLATLSGVARLDIASDTFLPMQDGGGFERPAQVRTRPPVASPVRVSITAPRELELVTGTFEITGTASRANGTVDRVEVQIGDGAWQTAEGTTSWRFTWDTTTATSDETLVVSARAFSGANASRVAQVLAIPVQPPTTPLEVEALVPPNATAGRPLTLAARVVGDEPLTVVAHYRFGNATSFTRLPLAKAGALHSAQVPAREVVEGPFEFYVEARSGAQAKNDPDDLTQPYRITVVSAPRLALAVSAPARIDARAGESTSVAIEVVNTGTREATFTLGAVGKRPDWIVAPAEPRTLAPGDRATVDVAVRIPAGAFADTWNVTFEARDVTGVADPATTTSTLAVEAAAVATPPPTDGAAPSRIPTPLAALLVALGAAALLRRRS